MEILFEIFINLFGELIVQALVALFVHLANYFNVNTLAKRILKYFIYTIIFAATLTLLGFAISNQKNIYTTSILIYFFIMILLYIVRFTIQEKNNETALTLIIWLIRLIHFIFPIIMIVIASINHDETSIYIVLASLAVLLIYVFIYAYRIRNLIKRKKNIKAKKAE